MVSGKAGPDRGQQQLGLAPVEGNAQLSGLGFNVMCYLPAFGLNAGQLFVVLSQLLADKLYLFLRAGGSFPGPGQFLDVLFPAHRGLVQVAHQ